MKHMNEFYKLNSKILNQAHAKILQLKIYIKHMDAFYSWTSKCRWHGQLYLNEGLKRTLIRGKIPKKGRGEVVLPL